MKAVLQDDGLWWSVCSRDRPQPQCTEQFSLSAAAQVRHLLHRDFLLQQEGGGTKFGLSVSTNPTSPGRYLNKNQGLSEGSIF